MYWMQLAHALADLKYIIGFCHVLFHPCALSHWPTFKLLGITYLIGRIKFKLLFHGPLAEWVFRSLPRNKTQLSSPKSSQHRGFCLDPDNQPPNDLTWTQDAHTWSLFHIYIYIICYISYCIFISYIFNTNIYNHIYFLRKSIQALCNGPLKCCFFDKFQLHAIAQFWHMFMATWGGAGRDPKRSFVVQYIWIYLRIIYISLRGPAAIAHQAPRDGGSSTSGGTRPCTDVQAGSVFGFWRDTLARVAIYISISFMEIPKGLCWKLWTSRRRP